MSSVTFRSKRERSSGGRKERHPQLQLNASHQANQTAKSCEVDMGSFLTQWYVTINPTRTSFSQPVPTSASLVFVLGNPLKANSKDYYHTCLSYTALHCDHRLTSTRRKIKRYALLFFLLDILIFYIFFSSKTKLLKNPKSKKGLSLASTKFHFRVIAFFAISLNQIRGSPVHPSLSFPRQKSRESREQTGEKRKK